MQFLTTEWSDAKGIEKAADHVLLPVRYLFNGRKITHLDHKKFDLSSEKSCKTRSFLRTTAAIVALAPCLIIGTFLKLCAGKKVFQNYRDLKAVRKYLEDLDETQINIQKIAEENLKKNDTVWDLNKYFGNIYVILGSEERKKIVTEEFQKVGLTVSDDAQHSDVQLFPGVKGADLPENVWSRQVEWAEYKGKSEADKKKMKQGRMGCLLAHYNVVKDAKEKHQIALNKLKNLKLSHASDHEIEEAKSELKRYQTVIIFEDNAAFGRVDKHNAVLLNETVRRLFHQTVSNLPKNWDMLYLMGINLFGIPRLHSNLSRTLYSLSGKSYAVHSRFYDTILEQLEASLSSTAWPLDHELALTHRKGKVYTAKKSICYRKASPSLVGSTTGDSVKNWQIDSELGGFSSIPFFLRNGW